jgi:hypothetical protein
MIATASIDPVAVDPDITIARGYRAGIDNIGGLVAYIAVHRTAGGGQTACYSNDH